MLEQFLERATRTPFVDGVEDCALMAANWAVACGWPDPAAAYRGRYRTALGRERLLRREGGLLAVMSAGFGSAGLANTEEPKRGDVGVVDLNGMDIAAICLGDRWVAKAPAGVTAWTTQAVRKAWKI